MLNIEKGESEMIEIPSWYILVMWIFIVALSVATYVYYRFYKIQEHWAEYWHQKYKAIRAKVEKLNKEEF